MAKDTRYNTVRKLILADQVKNFREIFVDDTIPKSVIARDLGMNNERFTKVMYNMEEFGMKHILRLAVLIDIDRKILIDIILAQYDIDRQYKK